MAEEKEEKKQESKSSKKASPKGVGIDLGTMNIIASRKNTKGNVQTKRIRDAFLDLEPDAKKMLKMSGVSYVEYDDRILILGDPALEMANLFKREARRPLQGGLISSNEIDALEVLSILIENVIGDPQEGGEICYYSIPAKPLGVDSDVTYHEAVFKRIIEELGYTAIPGNEAMAIVYSECAQDGFSGIAVSYGAGMANIALSYMTMPIMQFSIQNSGDWVDQQAAKAVGSTASRMCSIKEKGLDLMNPEGREQEAIVVYYRSLIDRTITKIAEEFKKTQSDTELKSAIPIVVSGGTSLAEGFLDLFKEEFERRREKFPIEVSEIRHAQDPMNAVSQGLLVQAQAEYSD